MSAWRPQYVQGRTRPGTRLELWRHLGDAMATGEYIAGVDLENLPFDPGYTAPEACSDRVDAVRPAAGEPKLRKSKPQDARRRVEQTQATLRRRVPKLKTTQTTVADQAAGAERIRSRSPSVTSSSSDTSTDSDARDTVR